MKPHSQMAIEGLEKRKLAAIMFTDMVGYSALAQRDEVLALELLEEHRALLRPALHRRAGRITVRSGWNRDHTASVRSRIRQNPGVVRAHRQGRVEEHPAAGGGVSHHTRAKNQRARASWSSTAQFTAATALANSTRKPSPIVFILVLLQHARQRGWPAHAIDSEMTSVAFYLPELLLPSRAGGSEDSTRLARRH
jgi:hypothetical protein